MKPNSTQTQSNRVVLIIDDEAGIRDVLALSLQIRAIEVHTAKNGQDGLDLLTKMPRPCLILLDLMMPVMNGWDFVRALDAQPQFAGLPVALITAFPEEIEFDRAVAVFSKPLDLRRLYDLIGELCKNTECASS